MTLHEPAQIPLSRGLVALIDADDYAWASQWKWHAAIKGGGYVYAARRESPSRAWVLLHRALLGVVDVAILVDHINRDTLDDRRTNLRPCTRSLNAANSRTRRRRSRFRGVIQVSESSTFAARITVRGRIVRLGNFRSDEDAARAWDQAALDYFGEFAQLNFPQEIRR